MIRLAFLLTLLLAACGSTSPAASAPPTKLVVGLSQVIPQFLPAWVAKDAGIYARNGLDVDQRNSPATTVMQALLSGELTLAITGGPETLNATANGADLAVVANVAPVAALKLLVQPGIQSKGDLVGKKIGITRIGSTTHSNAQTLFRDIGLNSEKDVSYVQLDNNQGEAAGLLSGQIQAALLAPPESTKLEAQGFRVLYDLSAMKYPATGQLVVMPRAWLNGHHAAAQQFVDSIVQALTRVRQDKSAAIASLKNNVKLDDGALLDGTYEYFAGSILAPEPYARPEQLANDLAVIQQGGKLASFDAASIIDSSLVSSAVGRGLARV